MNRALIIAAAGRSTRFSQSLGREVLKVIYSGSEPEECLLGHQLSLIPEGGFSRVIIVGGYLFESLSDFVALNTRKDLSVQVVFNDHYRDYGTCYSFACGVKALENDRYDEVVFMEGDLFFDSLTFRKIVSSDKDVVTANSQIISAETSVVFCLSDEEEWFFVYDTEHRRLQFPMSIKCMGNSGQVWKFRDFGLLLQIISSLDTELHSDSNLTPIANYFNSRRLVDVEIIQFEKWFNCNRIQDFQEIANFWKEKR